MVKVTYKRGTTSNQILGAMHSDRICHLGAIMNLMNGFLFTIGESLTILWTKKRLQLTWWTATQATTMEGRMPKTPGRNPAWISCQRRNNTFFNTPFFIFLIKTAQSLARRGLWCLRDVSSFFLFSLSLLSTTNPLSALKNAKGDFEKACLSTQQYLWTVLFPAE